MKPILSGKRISEIARGYDFNLCYEVMEKSVDKIPKKKMYYSTEMAIKQALSEQLDALIECDLPRNVEVAYYQNTTAKGIVPVEEVHKAFKAMLKQIRDSHET